jgi:hypothetical protein
MFEEYIFDNQEILGDVVITHRQIRTGTKEGIPDMLGVDQDGRICIIELKNQQANEHILTQALSYAIWAESNPDSLKAIWLESKRKPEDIQIDWENLDIRILLVAPAFKAIIQRMAGKIGYPIDLIQIRRFSFKADEFLLVEILDKELVPKPQITTVHGEWDWDYYEQEHGEQAAAHFRSVVREIDLLTKKNNWDLSYNLNKTYTGFKLGNRVLFAVGWSGIEKWRVNICLPEKTALNLDLADWKTHRYDTNNKCVILDPKNGVKSDIEQLGPLFIQAYNFIAGTD